jgi:chromosomal replication initiation ATPase DnaA
VSGSARNARAANDPARQLTFDLGHRTAHGREDYLVAPSNQDAVAWIDLWPDWPAPALVLYGPAACGKTHLAAVWRERVKAIIIETGELASGNAADILKRGPHFVIDPVDPWIGDRTAETTLFHLYNLAREQKKTILLTMRVAPVHLDYALPDLASRLRAAPAAPVQAPDETLLGAVLVKMFADRQVTLGHDVLNYILPRMERSFAAARDLVERADKLALAEKRALSVPLVRQVLLEQAGD